MKKFALLGLTVMCASVVMAGEMDLAPGEPYSGPTGGPTYGTDFGERLRSFSINLPYPGGVAVHPDGYLSVARWSNSVFTQWSVYTTTGSLVRTVSVTAGRYNGCRDGSGRCHLGAGYFVTAQERGGIVRWTYAKGGNPGGSGTVLFSAAAGRGVSYDGTYYYATTGAYGSALGIYTTAGSLVRTVPGSSGSGSSWYQKYGNAMRFTQRDGHVLFNKYNYGVLEGNYTTGSIRRSFATGTSFAAGADYGWNSDKELYVADQASTGKVVVFNAPGGETAVAPSSLGKIKTLYR